MSVGLLGRKIGMTQVYDADGVIVPVTVIEAGPCVVLQIRSMDRDGYDAVQIGFADRSRAKSSRLQCAAMLPYSMVEDNSLAAWLALPRSQRLNVNLSGLCANFAVKTLLTA